MGQQQDYKVALVNTGVTGPTIAAGQTTSSTFDCGGTAPVGLITPSGFTSASLSFNVSKSPSGPFVPLTNFDGTAFAIAAVASKWIPLQPAMFNGITYMQIISSVMQVSAVVIDLQLAPIYQGLHA